MYIIPVVHEGSIGSPVENYYIDGHKYDSAMFAKYHAARSVVSYPGYHECHRVREGSFKLFNKTNSRIVCIFVFKNFSISSSNFASEKSENL